MLVLKIANTEASTVAEEKEECGPSKLDQKVKTRKEPMRLGCLLLRSSTITTNIGNFFIRFCSIAVSGLEIWVERREAKWHQVSTIELKQHYGVVKGTKMEEISPAS